MFHTTKKIVNTLYFAGAVALILSFFRLYALIQYGFSTEFPIAFNNISEIAVLWGMAAWGINYARIHQWAMNLPGEKTTMKIISFITGILCWVRAVSATLYFGQRLVEDNSWVTLTYVGGSILLWFALGVFFLLYWYRNRQSEKIDD